MFDVAIIGSGPAALTAALYSTRAGKKATIFERATVGGLTAQISQVENYPGFTGSGAELTKRMRTQAEQSGANFAYGDCKKLAKNDDGTFTLQIDHNQIHARTVIIASGNDPRPLGVPGEDMITISRCATCDAALYKGKNVTVIGGGDSALQESLHLANLAAKVTIISRSPLRASAKLIARIQNETANVEIRENTTIKGFAKLDVGVQVIHLQLPDGREEYFQTNGIFAYVGYVPATKFLTDSGVELSAEHYVITDNNRATNISGIFAAGDVIEGSPQQVITAASDGAIAAMSAIKYLDTPAQ